VNIPEVLEDSLVDHLDFIHAFFFKNEGGLQQSLLHRSKPPGELSNAQQGYNIYTTCVFSETVHNPESIKYLKMSDLSDVFTL